MPAVPLGHAGRYVAAAYIVFFALVLIYVAIMSVKLSRMERELAELNELADRRLGGRFQPQSPPAPPPPPVTSPAATTTAGGPTTTAAPTNPPAPADPTASTEPASPTPTPTTTR